mgnify:CR=1 FL=1
MEPAANNLPVIQEDLDLALLTARDLMSTPIRSIDPATTIAEAQQILLRYGHSGLPIVSRSNVLVGIISRRDVEIAAHHGFAFAPVAGLMTTTVKIIASGSRWQLGGDCHSYRCVERIASP